MRTSSYVTMIKGSSFRLEPWVIPMPTLATEVIVSELGKTKRANESIIPSCG